MRNLNIEKIQEMLNKNVSIKILSEEADKILDDILNNVNNNEIAGVHNDFPKGRVINVKANSQDSENKRHTNYIDRINKTDNVKKLPDYRIVCVIPSMYVPEENYKDFEEFVYEKYKIRIQFLEIVFTGKGYGGEGGRPDIIFAIHAKDAFTLNMLRFMSDSNGQPLISVLREYSIDNEMEMYPSRIAGYLF